jgi:hypothetical protein
MDSSPEQKSFTAATASARWLASRPCTGTVVVLGQAPRHADVVAGLADAVARHPRLRQRRVKHGPFGDEWADLPGFDLSFHLRWERLGSDRDLLRIATQRFFRPFARQAPPWEVHVLEGGTRALLLLRHDPSLDDDGRLCAVVLGALCADGADEACSADATATGATTGPRGALLAALESLLPEAAALRDSTAALLNTAREAASLSAELVRATLGASGRDGTAWSSDLGAAALRTARSLGALVTARLAENSAAALRETSGARRGLALVDLPLGALDAVRRPLGLTTEDVLLSISAGALARLEQAQRGVRPRSLRARISLPEARRTGLLLPLAERDPLRRAAHVHELLAALGGEMQQAAMKTLAGLMTALPIALASGASPRRAPRYDLELAYRELPLHGRDLAGAHVQRVYPFTASGDTTGLAVGAQRFDRWLTLGLAYDGEIVGRPRGLVDAWHASCGEFLHAAIDATARKVDGRAHVSVAGN